MSAVIQALLTADSVLILFEEMGGLKQVSSLVAELNGSYASFDLIDDDRAFSGAVFLIRSALSSDRIKAALEAQSSEPIRLTPKTIRVLGTSILVDGQMATTVEAMTFSDEHGACMSLVEDGACYRYNLTLREGPLPFA